jgi:hypothetical protein
MAVSRTPAREAMSPPEHPPTKPLAGGVLRGWLPRWHQWLASNRLASQGDSPILQRGPRSAQQVAAGALLAGAITFGLLHLGLVTTAAMTWLIRDPVYADKELRLARIERAAPGPPVVVFLGTSRGGYGFEAGRVVQATGGRIEAFNFGIPATGPVSHLVYLRRLVEAGHRPALLLVEILPPALADLPDGPLEGRFADGNRFRQAELNQVAGYRFPVAKLRSQWRESLINPWYSYRFHLLGRISPTLLPWHVRFDWGRPPDPRGWNAAIGPEPVGEQAQAGFQQATLEYAGILRTTRPGGPAVQALSQLLDLAREHGIPTRLVLMPEAVPFQALYPRAYRVKLEQVLAEVARDVPIHDARNWVPDDGFRDGHHLNRTGAALFTDRLIREVIGPALGGLQ